MGKTANVVEQPGLRDRHRVFRDRTEAGVELARMLEPLRRANLRVFAIPAGGVPVAAAIAAEFGLPLDAAVVSKITLPWNTESGYGAVAFDGTVRLNDDLVRRLHLSSPVIDEGIAKTRAKVRQRVDRLRGGRSPLDLSAATAILVDDGLASGFTMLVAIEAIRRAGAREVVVAVPTGHDESVARVAHAADAVYCANIRSGDDYAVADAYEHWTDVTEAEAARTLGVASIARAALPA